MNNKILISMFAATALVSTSVVAKQTIELKEGWNLIGIQEKPFNETSWTPASLASTNTAIKTITNVTRTYSTSATRNSLSALEAGKGYWLEASSDSSLILDGTLTNYQLETVNPGWNLVTTPKNIDNISEFVETMNSKGFKINVITNVTRTYTVGATRNSLSVLDINSGYWINSKSLALRAKTSDGIYLDFYADDTSDTLASGLSAEIAALTYAEVVSGSVAPSNFTSFSGEVVVSTADQYTDEISNLTHDLVTVSSTGITGLPASDAVVNDTTSIEKVVLYTYSLEEAGSPQIVSGATLISIADDGTETELGTSDSNGLLVPTQDIRGTKVVVRFDGLADATLNLTSSYDKASYYVIMPSGATEEVTEEAELDTTTSSRILSRDTNVLEREISKYKSIKSKAVYHQNQVSVQMGTKTKFTITQNSVPDATALETAIAETSYIPTIVTALDVTMKKSTTNKTLNPSKTTFDDLYWLNSEDSKYNSDIDAFYLGLYDDTQAASIYSDLNSTSPQGKLEVYMYKNDAWVKLNGHSSLLSIDSLDTSDSEENNVKKRLKKSEYFIKLTDLGVATSAEYNGYYPLAVVYKQKNVTQKEFTVTVKDSSTNSPIKNALVRMGASNYVTDDAGEVVLSVTVTGDGALIPLSASEPKHLRAVSSIDPTTLTEDTVNNTILMLDPIPDSATVTGTVLDRDSKDGVSNAKVSITNPISLDKAKPTTKNGVRGIEIGLDPTATYTWYIKEVVEPTVSARTLARVSSTSWTTVKEAVGSEGNFIANNEIIKTLLKPTTDSTESDALSGLFDIAVKIEHDIDGDGEADYIELALNGDVSTVLNETNSSTTDVVTTATTAVSDDFVQNYGKKIGQIKIALDANKVAEESTDAQDSGEVIFVTATNKYYQGTADETFVDLDDDDSMEDTYANFHLAIGGGSDARAFRIDGFSTDLVGPNAELTWKVAIFADIVDGSENVVSSVLLDENYQWQPLNAAKDNYEDLLEIERGEILASNANYVVGSLKYVEGNLVSADSTISYKRLMRSIADDKIIKALNKTIAEIATEAGVVTTGVTDTSIKMLKDGISITLVADIKYTRDPDDANESVQAILHTDGLTLKADKVEDLLTITDTPVSPLSQVSGEMNTFSDRAGEFRFTRVPYDFAKLNDSQSLMRLGADRFDYFGNNVNIDAFEAQESQLTTVQQNIDIKAKNAYSVTLDLGNSATTLSDVAGATVVITGSKSNNGDIATHLIGADGNLSALARVIPNTDGITPTYDDILEGYQNIIVFKDGFKPFNKTLNITSNQTLSVNWETVGDPADFKTVVDIDYDSSTVDLDSGKAIITGNAFDKDDEKLSNDAVLTLIVNNEPQTSKVTVDHTTGVFLVSFDLPKGKSDAQIVASNDKGVSSSSKVYYDYNPDFGNLKGLVSGIVTGEFAIVSLFNENNEPITNAVPDENGNYNFISLPVGDYVLSAMAYDIAGNEYPSNTVDATVVGGKLITSEELIISHSVKALSGAPIVEFTIDDATVTDDVRLIATVDNFEFGDDVSQRFTLVLNDTNIEVEKSNFTAAYETNSYTFSYNLPFTELQGGQNTAYIVASNKNSKYDFSSDLYITTEDTDTSVSVKDVEFINKRTNTVISDDYLYLDLYNYSGELKAHYVSDFNGTSNYVVTGSLDAGKYYANIFSDNENYVGFSTLVDVNSSGMYVRGVELPDVDTNGMYEIALNPQSDNSNIAPELNLPAHPINLINGDEFVLYDVARDMDGDTLTITANSNDIGIVTVNTNDGMLELTANGDGKTTINVSVTDGTDTIEGSFIVSVTTPIVVNFAPQLFAPTDIYLDEIYTTEIIEAFDPEDDNLTITANINESVATATISGNIITVTGIATGATSLVVSVDDGSHPAVIRTINVNVSMGGDDESVDTPPSPPYDPSDSETPDDSDVTMPPQVPTIEQ